MYKYLILITLTLISHKHFAHGGKNNSCIIQKQDVKINNNTQADIVILNNSSGAHFKLPKNKISTIKVNIGDKLYVVTNGKKGVYLLTATLITLAKVQMLSKLLE